MAVVAASVVVKVVVTFSCQRCLLAEIYNFAILEISTRLGVLFVCS